MKEKIPDLIEIPRTIDLYTRTGKCETKLKLSEVHKGNFTYSIEAQYSYSLLGEEGNYVAVDFSEGPTLSIGDTCSVIFTVSKINQNEIVFKLKS